VGLKDENPAIVAPAFWLINAAGSLKEKSDEQATG
jgi:hypothetical protein